MVSSLCSSFIRSEIDTTTDLEYIKEMKRLDFEFYGNDPHRLMPVRIYSLLVVVQWVLTSNIER